MSMDSVLTFPGLRVGNLTFGLLLDVGHLLNRKDTTRVLGLECLHHRKANRAQRPKARRWLLRLDAFRQSPEENLEPEHFPAVSVQS